MRCSSSVQQLVATAALLAASKLGSTVVSAHPGCYTSNRLTKDIVPTLCPADADGVCCTADQEDELFDMYFPDGLSGDCAELYKKVCDERNTW